MRQTPGNGLRDQITRQKGLFRAQFGAAARQECLQIGDAAMVDVAVRRFLSPVFRIGRKRISHILMRRRLQVMPKCPAISANHHIAAYAERHVHIAIRPGEPLVTAVVDTRNANLRPRRLEQRPRANPDRRTRARGRTNRPSTGPAHTKSGMCASLECASSLLHVLARFVLKSLPPIGRAATAC